MIYKSYITEEVSNFSTIYFDTYIETNHNRAPRNEEDGSLIPNQSRLSIFNVKKKYVRANQKRMLEDDEVEVAHRYVLLNSGMPKMKTILE